MQVVLYARCRIYFAVTSSICASSEKHGALLDKTRLLQVYRKLFGGTLPVPSQLWLHNALQIYGSCFNILMSTPVHRVALWPPFFLALSMDLAFFLLLFTACYLP